MATISKTVATLRISGEELVPEEVSALLGHPPDAEPGDLDGQVSYLLGKLTSDLAVWKDLAARFDMDLFCGLFMDGEMEGLSLSPESLMLLGERGIELGLEIYSGDN